MILRKFYVIYALVPSGYVGVETVYGESKEKTAETIRSSGIYAVLDILEGR